MSWSCPLTLDSNRNIVDGSEAALVDAIRRGADLRIGTEFVHNEHIDVRSECDERVREVAEFGITYLIDDRWAAGIMSLRQPVELPNGFGPRPSMSFFLYNQDGHQAIARPYLDGVGPDDKGTPETSPIDDHPEMPKYHQIDAWDVGTNAPSQNFIYDFDVYRFHVRDDWEEVIAHDAEGNPISGSVDALADAFSEGLAVKVGISGLCSDLSETSALDHEVFVQVGSCYYYQTRKLFVGGSHPVVRVQPDVPMRYRSEGWDFGWLVLKTNGEAVHRRCDPQTLGFDDRQMRLGIRWFVR